MYKYHDVRPPWSLKVLGAPDRVTTMGCETTVLTVGIMQLGNVTYIA